MGPTLLVKWVAILFLIGGLLSLIIGVPLALSQTKHFLKHALHTTGMIEDYTIHQKRNSDGKTSRVIYGVIRYTDTSGKTHVFETPMSDSIQIGDTIDVLYTMQAGKKNDARLNHFFPIWGSVLISSILGTIFTIVGAVLVYVAWWRLKS